MSFLQRNISRNLSHREEIAVGSLVCTSGASASLVSFQVRLRRTLIPARQRKSYITTRTFVSVCKKREWFAFPFSFSIKFFARDLSKEVRKPIRGGRWRSSSRFKFRCRQKNGVGSWRDNTARNDARSKLSLEILIQYTENITFSIFYSLYLIILHKMILVNDLIWNSRKRRDDQTLMASFITLLINSKNKLK